MFGRNRDAGRKQTSHCKLDFPITFTIFNYIFWFINLIFRTKKWLNRNASCLLKMIFYCNFSFRSKHEVCSNFQGSKTWKLRRKWFTQIRMLRTYVKCEYLMSECVERSNNYWLSPQSFNRAHCYFEQLLLNNFIWKFRHRFLITTVRIILT